MARMRNVLHALPTISSRPSFVSDLQVNLTGTVAHSAPAENADSLRSCAPFPQIKMTEIRAGLGRQNDAPV